MGGTNSISGDYNYVYGDNNNVVYDLSGFDFSWWKNELNDILYW